jgi:hypothetical protein
MSHDAAAAAFPSPRENRAAMLWGIAVGLLQAATPLLIWWLNRATVYALGLVVIAGIYVGFAVADGRARVIAVESGVAFVFVVVAAAAVTDRITVAARRRHGRPRAQGPLAAPHALRVRHAVVAAVLHGRRLGRRRHHHRRDRRRHALRMTIRIASAAGARTTVVAKLQLGASPGDR